ncbi:response regulator [Mariniflexile litorale]|uniref:Response regulator n=1 Tax=Mariniflexile litorale TaxID=3045158 RepID=A0AAU7EKA5_9FLAO|nr:response regulator [Mariniflexile sp. KMM 9835]MDQ8213253.1 response regulator [Mariniflexile sp. KMM 9835]
MNKIIKVLLIEDEPLTIEAYQRALNETASFNESLEFDIDSASNCDNALLKLKGDKTNCGIDIVFLDMRIPSSKDGVILSGEDLGIKIKNTFKNIKIIVSTSYDDAFRISSILKSINPDGFLIKSDLSAALLLEAIKVVVSEPPYYSQTVLQILRKQATNDFVVDNIDRKMLYELSNGTKMNELPQVLPLSIAALERRKRLLRDIFNVTGKGDRDLLTAARERGFI